MIPNACPNCYTIKDVCKEIEDFIHTLYSCTEDKAERVAIKDMLQKILSDL